MTSNDNGKNAFTSDEATKIICTALTNGSLVLPLNKKLQDLGLVQFVKLCAGKNVINDEDDVEEVAHPLGGREARGVCARGCSLPSCSPEGVDRGNH